MGRLEQTPVLSFTNSLTVQTVDSAWFEIGWQSHAANEIIMFTEGSGFAFIGNYEGNFEADDIFLVGSQIPHFFHQKSNKPINAIVIQFLDDFLGIKFINLPECEQIKKLLEIARYGLQFTGSDQRQLQQLIRKLETASDINGIILLLQCLQTMAYGKEYISLSTGSTNWNNGDDAVIDKVLQFTLKRFSEPITLEQVATIACMSLSAFCHYFKRCMHKTYFDFLNEIRIAYACSELLRTNKSVTEIGYESGYNTIVHFHRQFLKLEGITPLQFRKRFSGDRKTEKSEIYQQPFSWSFN